MAVTNSQRLNVWREESTPSFGGPHGLWVGDSQTLVGDVTGGDASIDFTAPFGGLYLMDAYWVETETDGVGYGIAMQHPARQAATLTRLAGGRTASLEAFSLGFGDGVINARLYCRANAAGVILLRFGRANVNGEDFRVRCSGRYWDLSLIRERGVPINWPS